MEEEAKHILSIRNQYKRNLNLPFYYITCIFLKEYVFLPLAPRVTSRIAMRIFFYDVTLLVLPMLQCYTIK